MHKISNLLNVQKIVTIHYQTLGKNYVFPEERHDFWEINYADKGNISVGIDGEKIELKQGEMLFIKPNQSHFVETGNKEPNLFIISFACRSESMNFFSEKKYAVPSSRHSALPLRSLTACSHGQALSKLLTYSLMHSKIL